MTRALSPARFGRALVAAGAALAVVGLLPWLAFVIGADGADDWLLLALGIAAVVGGAFIALIGVGILRQARGRAWLLAERRLDETALATVAAADTDTCGADCTTCTASCALQELRR